MNLLTVLVPPREAVTDLAAALENVQPPPGWRKEPPKRWVLPLAAHPHDDLGVRARYLERTLRGAPAPWMRLAGASRDDRACWVRVEAEPERLLRDLVVAAGGDVETSSCRPSPCCARHGEPGQPWRRLYPGSTTAGRYGNLGKWYWWCGNRRGAAAGTFPRTACPSR